MFKEFVHENFKGDRTIWFIYIALFVISAIEVFSATSSLVYAKGGNSFSSPIISHLLHGFFGFGIAIVVHNIKVNRLAKTMGWFGFWGCVVWVVLVSLTSQAINGAARWATIPGVGIKIQPSEILKLCYIIAMAYWFSKYAPTPENKWRLIKISTFFTLVAGIVVGHDNGSNGILIFATGLLIYILAFSRIRLFIIYLIIAIGLFSSYKLVTSTSVWEDLGKSSWVQDPDSRVGTWYARIDRFAHEKQPGDKGFEDYYEHNFQSIHGKMAIANSNGIGVLPGRSKERDYLPQAYSDFIYAIIVEETGIEGGLFTLFLYLLLLYRVGRIIARCKSRYAAIVAAGIGFMLVLQALTNMCVAVGLIPVTGQPLPLVSRGGTSAVIISIYFGILLSISKHECGDDDTKKKEEQIEADTATASTEVATTPA